MYGNSFKLILLMIACVAVPLSSSGNSVTVEEFFMSHSNLESKFNEKELYPGGKLLTFSMYSVGSPELEKINQDGFTAIGPYYGDQTRSHVIQRAREYGVKCFYSVGNRIDFVKDPNYVMPSNDEIREQITAEVKAVADNPEIAVWNLRNEELRHWRPDEMRWLEIAGDAVRAADPYGRPVMMYEPNHRNADALAKTVKYQDICAKGMYANAAGFKDNRIWIRWGVEQELKALERANPNATPFAVLWMAWDPKDPSDVPLIDDWTRHDVYLSLITGAKGIIVWSGYNRRKGFEEYFTDFYEGYASAARELNGRLNLSRIFLFGQKQNSIEVEVINGPAVLKLDYDKEIHTYSSVSHLDVAYEGTRYLFMANSANSPITALVKGLPLEEILKEDVLGNGETKGVSGGEFSVSIPGLGVKCFHFSPKIK